MNENDIYMKLALLADSIATDRSVLSLILEHLILIGTDSDYRLTEQNVERLSYIAKVLRADFTKGDGRDEN